MRIAMKSTTLILTGLACLTAPQLVQACPFCMATQQTISEEIDAAEICVVAKLVETAAASGNTAADFDPADEDTDLARFSVQTVLRGDARANELDEIKVVYFGSNETGKPFLISALSLDGGLPVPHIEWTTPLPLTPRGIDYVGQLADLPETGADRLAFFQQYLEDDDPLLAQDAYDEFARAPYADVIDLANRMDRQQLLHWIESPEVGPTRRRLYLTMFGVCGKKADADKLESLLLYDYPTVKPGVATLLATIGHTGPIHGVSVIEELVRADIRRRQRCLDALIAAYLKLKGPSGLDLIDKKFLDNPSADYSNVYAALMALRFHGEETDVLPRERLLTSMKLLLDNELFADQVVADLARWGDWTVLDRLVDLFHNAKEDSWIRQPVVSYLFAATEQPGDVGQRATTALTELKKVDPACIERTRRFLDLGLFARAITKTEDSPATVAGDHSAEATPLVGEKEAPLTSEPVETPVSPAAIDQRPAPVAVAPPTEVPVPNRWMLVGMPILAGVLMMGIFALLIRGADVRSGSHGDDTVKHDD
ncbi:MAG: hypothetical protein MK171_13275 [Pirellulales bacterium]|nr:hypothetical protein [Pirellulales bacterium]